MIVCMPTEGEQGLEEKIAEHFGRAKTYTLFDTSTNKLRVIPTNGKHGKENGSVSELLLKESVEAVLASEIGLRFVEGLKSDGIWIYTGAQGTVWDTIISWRKGNLSRTIPQATNSA